MNNIICLNEKDSKQFNKAMKESKLNKDIISKGILLLKKLTSEKERLNMDCNIHCYWNYNGQCCPESKEEIEQALPNNKKCPTYLVPNFEKDLKNILDECKILLHFRNYEQLKEIRNFIQNQSKEYIDILYQIEDYIINTKQLKGFYLEHIIKKFNISESITTDIINYYINKGLLEEQIEVRCPNCNDVIGYQNDKKFLNDTIKGNCFCDNCEELITTMDFMENTKNYYKVIRK